MDHTEQKDRDSTFAEEAGLYLAGETLDASNVLSHIRGNKEHRRAFFKALEADILLERESVPPARSVARNILFTGASRFAGLAAAVLLVASFGLGVYLLAGRPGETATLKISRGHCRVEDGGEAKRKGAELFASAGALSFCDLALGDAMIRLRVAPRSAARIQALDGGWLLDVQRGHVHLDVPRKPARIQVRAGDVRVLVTGTRVSVERKNASVRIRLLEGEVLVRRDAKSSEQLRMRAGTSMSIRKGESRTAALPRIEVARLSRIYESIARLRDAPPRGADDGRHVQKALRDLAPNAWPARLYLKGGRSFKGLVRQLPGEYLIVLPDGELKRIPARMVERLELTGESENE